MAFMLDNKLFFVDSFQFMSLSLDKLVSNLPKESLKYTSEKFKGKKLDLMSQKGVYPYSFEKDFFKLMNNSVFGKTMENIRKRVDVRIVTDKNKLLKLTPKPTYVSSKMFNENRVAVHKIKECLILKRPAYVGMCILDLSKTLLYDFHYNYIKQKYKDKASCYLPILAHYAMRFKQKMFIKTSGRTKYF